MISYSPRTYKENGKFYPAVLFNTTNIRNETFYLDNPQPTRSKARTIAKQEIKKLLDEES